MEKEFKPCNLSVKGVDVERFLDPFYAGSCEKINFKGVIEEYKIESPTGIDYISLAPKFKPHSDYELMLQSTDSICKSSSVSLSDEALYKIFGTGYEFIKFLSDPEIIRKYNMKNGYPYLVLNSDEFTTDRHSGMSKKPFHLHLNSWKEDTISKIQPIDKSKVSSYYYKSVVDPIFDLTQTLAHDALDCEEFKPYLVSKNPSCGDGNINYSSVYEIKEGWKFLETKDFTYIIKNIHKRLEIRYIEILKCFTGKTEIPELYTRHPLLDKREIRNNISVSNMEDMTKIALMDLTERLISITPEQFQRISKNLNLRDTLISLRWLAYSIGLFSPEYIDDKSAYVDKPLYINVTPRLFTKIGGASIMNFPDHPHVKIDRGEGNICSEEFNQRLEFHKEFNKTLKLRRK